MTSWQRLDRRMLLVHPITSVTDAWPGLLGLVIAGSASGEAFLGLLALPVLLAIGVARYLTTTWRVAEDRVEVRRGLLRRETLSTHIDRVRTVDLSASLVHRALGLSTITVGTGIAQAAKDDGLELDSLRREAATALRSQLLERARRVQDVPAAPTAPDPTDPTSAGPATSIPPPPVEEPTLEVARFDYAWLRYAPFSGGALIAAGALAAGVGHLVNQSELALGGRAVDWIAGATAALAVGAALVVALGGLVVVVLLAVVSYLLANHGFSLRRQHGVWHVSRGLLTQRETSIDVDRVAGVRLPEGVLLRLVRGGRVEAVVTGLGSDPTSGVLLPAAPRALAEATATAVLGTRDPVEVPLRDHGPAARRRIALRAGVGGLVVAAAPVAAVALGAHPTLLLTIVPLVAVVVLLARDRWAGLGHARAGGFVVMRSGSMTRMREVLGDQHVIGWTTRANWFQRRAGLVHLSAITAAGRGGEMSVPDVPREDATALARAATPGLLDPFLVGTEATPIPHWEEPA